MPTLYFASVTVHVLAAMVWLGSMSFLAVVGAPVLQLVGTGILNLRYRGWLAWDGALSARASWATATGHALPWKLGAAATMIGVSAMLDFVLGPRAGAAAPGSSEAPALRTRALWAARLNALAGVVLVIAAVRLARGG